VAPGSGHPSPAPAVAFRRSSARWWIVLLTSVVPGLVFLSGALVNSTHGWEKIADGAAVLAFALLGVRTARLGIYAEPEQLVVRDYFRTYQIGWPEIASFELPPRYGTWRKSGLRIHLIDGRLISATLYRRGRLDSGRAGRTVVQELDRLRRHNTGDRPVHPQPPTTGS
jgi:Bacterial PH domain